MKVEKVKNYEVIVIATMSSGKSTLLNALLGDDILPSKCQACTSKIIQITDNDKLENFTGNAYYRNNKIKKYENLSKDDIFRINENTSFRELKIEGNIPGISNYKNRKIVFYDTPGPNNSSNLTHKDITLSFLKKNNDKTILFVLNAAQLSTNDDYELLKTVEQAVKKNNQIVFVLNKIDEIKNNLYEPISSLIENCIKYLEKSGIKNPKIIPTSSNAAKLFKFTLFNKNLNEEEKDEFVYFFKKFSRENYNMFNYCNLETGILERVKNMKIENYFVSTKNFARHEIEINGETYSKENTFSALKNTGLLFIEELFNKNIKL